MLTFTCANCGTRLQAPDEFAGKLMRCGDHTVRVPEPVTVAVDSTGKLAEHLRKAEMYSKSGRDGSAVAEYTAAIQLDPSRWELFLRRGKSYHRAMQIKDHYEKAVADFTEVLRLHPTCAEAYEERGLIYRHMGRDEESAADLSRASDLKMAVGLRTGELHDPELQNAQTRMQNAHQAISITQQVRNSNETSGVELMPYSAFLVQRPVEPVFVSADCQLGHSYMFHYENASGTHYNVKVGDLSKWKICLQAAYVPRNSEAGKELFSILKDGLEHKLVLHVACQGPDGTPTPDREEFAILGTLAHPFFPTSSVVQPPVPVPPPVQQAGYPLGSKPNPLVQAMIGQSQPSSQSSNASGSNPMASVRWWDCPWCGKTYKDESYDPNETVVCDECNSGFQTRQAINLRSTRERVETKSLVGRLWSGSSIQTPRRQRIIEQIRRYELLIRMCTNPISSTVQSLQEAQLYQMRITELKQELRDHGEC